MCPAVGAACVDDTDRMRHCQIVEAHYFRGRLTALDAAAKDSLLNERLFEDVLMKEGVITHSLPLVRRRDHSLSEKGLDVWFALEAYELTLLKRYDVTVLVACDRDYLPLVRKLNALGVAVMVLGWDFTHTDEMGVERQTVTSIDLLAEATYPLAMHEIIESAESDDAIINGLVRGRQRTPRCHARPRDGRAGGYSHRRRADARRATIPTGDRRTRARSRR